MGVSAYDQVVPLLLGSAGNLVKEAALLTVTEDKEEVREMGPYYLFQ